MVAAHGLPRGERDELRARLRGIVEVEHNLNALSDRLIAELTELVEERNG